MLISAALDLAFHRFSLVLPLGMASPSLSSGSREKCSFRMSPRRPQRPDWVTEKVGDLSQALTSRPLLVHAVTLHLVLPASGKGGLVGSSETLTETVPVLPENLAKGKNLTFLFFKLRYNCHFIKLSHFSTQFSFFVRLSSCATISINPS